MTGSPTPPSDPSHGRPRAHRHHRTTPRAVGRAHLAGVSLAGFQTTLLPQSRAGASFHAGICSGKFHGVMTPTVPTGRRMVRMTSSGWLDGNVTPSAARACPAW